MFRRSTVALLAALITAPTALLASAPRAHATAPGLNGRVAYVVPTPGPNVKNEIVTVNPDGTGAKNLTSGAGNDSMPAWSPDGSKLAFLSDRAGWGLYVMDADGANVQKVGSPAGLSGFGLAWSPSGSKLLFSASAVSGDLDLFTINIDGSGLMDVVTGPSLDFFPQWSPDGSKIVFMRRVSGPGSGAYIADADGSNVAALSPGQFDEYPSFSPDGTTIVFDRVVGSATEIFTMKPDGTGVTQVTTHGGTNELPRFSPDGTQIVFQTSKPAPAPSTGTIYGIAVVSADGTADRDLPVSPQQQFTAPDWQPITQPIAPGSPQQVSAVAGDGSATVSWAAGTYGGGVGVTGFTVTAVPGGSSATAPAGATSAMVTGLTNGTAYKFTVTATNSASITGPPSDASNAVMPHAVPVSVPTVTAVRMATPQNYNQPFPQVDVDWGPYASSPGGFIEFAGGAISVTPTGPSAFDLQPFTPPSPKSYRAVACPNSCPSIDLTKRDPTWVAGPWLRPVVGDALTLPAPTVTAMPLAQTSYPGPVRVTVLPGAHTSAPALVIYRDWIPAAVVTPSAPTFDDSGPFGPTASVSYAAAACYSDCVLPAVASGFAQSTPWGPGVDVSNPATAGSYFPVAPYRVLDTRDGTGAASAPIPPNSSIDVQTTGIGGIPASGVEAVALNVTVTQPTAPSYLTAWPTGVSRPLTSSLNFAAGQTVANFQIVRVGGPGSATGKISLYNAQGLTHAIVDVVGWYSDGSTELGARYQGVTPTRVVDTRIGTGAPAVPVGPDMSIEVDVPGHAGVDADWVTAAAVNVTATQATEGSYLTAWPSDESRPVASNLNFGPGQTVPNLVIVKVGADGKFRLYNRAGFTHVIVDVVGWYSNGVMGNRVGTRYSPLLPSRILDTRTTHSSVGPHSTIDVQATGRGGVPATGVSAVVINLTATEPTSGSYLTAFPTGTAVPLASNLNFGPGQTIPNLVVVKLGTGGMFSVYNAQGNTHVIADVVGWY